MTVLHSTSRSEAQADTAYSPTGQWVTEAEYWEKYYHYPDVVYEWNNGYLEERPVSNHVTYTVYEWFSRILGYFLQVHPTAELTGLGMGFKLVLPEKKVIRRPDMGMVLNANSVPILPHDTSYKGIFDACIEALSDSSKEDMERDMVSKKEEYAKGGVKEYYILDGHRNNTRFYRLNARGNYVSIRPTKSGLIKSKILPGFQFRPADLYTRPSVDELVRDSVYTDFVLPNYGKTIRLVEEAKANTKKKMGRRTEAKAGARHEYG